MHGPCGAAWSGCCCPARRGAVAVRAAADVVGKLDHGDAVHLDGVNTVEVVVVVGHKALERGTLKSLIDLVAVLGSKRISSHICILSVGPRGAKSLQTRHSHAAGQFQRIPASKPSSKMDFFLGGALSPPVTPLTGAFAEFAAFCLRIWFSLRRFAAACVLCFSR